MSVSSYNYHQLQASGLPRSEWSSVIAFARRHRASIQQAIDYVTYQARRVGVKSRVERLIAPGGELTAERPRTRARVEDGTGGGGTRLDFDMQVDNNDTGMFAGQKISYYVKKGGKKVSRRRKLLATLQAHVQPIIERWQGNTYLTPSNAPIQKVGYFGLEAGITSTTATQYPVWLFDLTGCYNQNSITAANLYPTVAYRVLGSNDLGQTYNNYYYAPATGRDATDTTNNYSWQTEKMFRAASGNLPYAGQSAFIDKVRVKLAVYGAEKVNSMVYVELWRFTDEQIAVPHTCGSSVSAVPTVDNISTDDNRLNAFWTYMMSKQIGTIDSDQVDINAGKGCDIRRLWTFKFGPQDTSNPDPSGAIRTLTLDQTINRYAKLDWNTSGAADEIKVNDISNPDVYEVNLSGNMNYPMPNLCSRVFLVVRADVSQMHTTGITPTEKAVLFPSFDITLRRFRSMVHT